MPGTSQLMSAIKSKNIGKLSKLLEKMDLNDVNAKQNGETALHLACRRNYNEAVDLLVAKNGIDVNVKNSRGETPLCMAVSDRNGYAVTKILSNPQVDVNVQDNIVNDGWTPLHIACGFNLHQITLELLASPGIDITVQDKWGKTPLHVACDSNYLQITLELVARPGVDINVQDKWGKTPLHYACGRNYLKIVSTLLAIPGVDVNVTDDFGFTPVMESAAYCQEEALKVILEDNSVDLDAKDRDGGGLEQQVGCAQGDSIQKKKCYEMIINERHKRENSDVQKGQQSQGGNNHIETAEKLNKQMEAFEKTLQDNLDIENMKGIGEKEKGGVVIDNEELMQGKGEEENDKGSLATVNEPKQENKDIEMMYSTLCWCCSKEDCKLYKCGGCRRARYCSDECIKNDWDVHGSYCIKKQQQRKKIKADALQAEQELEGPVYLE